MCLSLRRGYCLPALAHILLEMNDIAQRTEPPRSHSPNYRIRLSCQLDASWSEWFWGMKISQEPDGTCLLIGPVDQAALHGLLARIRDLGLTLLEVKLLAEPGEPMDATQDSMDSQEKKSKS